MVNVDANVSSRINLMRILLISGIVFVHIPYDPETSPFGGNYGAFDWLRVFLTEVIFRVGVPCLSAISGYLLFRRGAEDFNYRKTVATKTQTVLLPFLLWNTAVFLLVLTAQSQDMAAGYMPDLWSATPRETLSYLFATEDLPVDIPLYFLRDLFVCILLSPLLAFFIRRYPLLTLGLLFTIAVLPAITIGIVLKKSILFSFSFGIYAALYKIDLKALDRHALPIASFLLVAAALLTSALYYTGPDYPILADLLRNLMSIVGPVAFWVLSAILVRTGIGTRLSQTGSLSFWIFCAHYPLLILFWMVWNKTGIDYYPAFFIGSLFAAFLILVPTNAIVSRVQPGLYGVLTGGRNRARGKVRTKSGEMPAKAAPQQR